MTPRLSGTDRPLTEVYDVALLDLDGVVYVGDRPVDGAPAALASARDAGMRLAFVTNNASRTAEQVADRLSGMDVPAVPAEVTTSAQAAAHHVADRVAPGASVLVVGGRGLQEALRERGLNPVATAHDPQTGERVVAVVQGFAPDVGWTLLAEAAVAIREGAWWVATNLDRTIPSERGPLPGNGSLVHVLTYAFGVEPEATGKPDPVMHRESVQRSGAQRPVVVGDRLDTDVEGAVRAGAPSLLVLSGVTDATTLLTAGPGSRPDHVGRDVAALLDAHPEVGVGGRVGRWEVDVDGDTVTVGAVTGAAAGDDDALDLLRALTPAAWSVLDEGGSPRYAARDGDAEAGLRGWGLEVRTTSGA